MLSMRLNVSQLVLELEKRFSDIQKHIVSDAMELQRPLLYEQGCPLQDNRAYICTSDALKSITGMGNMPVLLLAVGGSDLQCVGNFQNICLFSKETELSVLLNATQAIFDRYDAWDAQLRDSMDVDGDLNELLNIAASALKNPVMVCAADYSILGRSNTIEDKGELLGSHISYKLIQKLKMNASFQKYAAQRRSYRFSETTSGTEFLCVNLYSGDEFAYRVIVADTERPITAECELLLEHVSSFVQRLLSDSRFTGALFVPESRFSRAESLLKSAISNEKIDYIPIINGLSDISWLQTHRYCCVCVKIGSLDYRAHTVKLLCNQLEELLKGSCAFEFSGNIVVLVNLELHGGGAEDVIGQMVYFLRDNFLKAGISDEFTGFMDMYYHHRQALIALDFVCRQQSYLWTARFQDVALPYMIEQCMHELPMHVVCERSILTMQRYDEDHGTFFYNTLACYIENRFNALQTAKKMFIHRSTFLYRMERIKELFRIDLENDDVLLYTMLSMKMLEQSRSMRPISELSYGKES